MFFYTHDLYLIERTKLLEGLMCQSITFTNAIRNNYTESPVNAMTAFSYSIAAFSPRKLDSEEEIKELFESALLVSPLEYGKISIPSIHTR